MSFLQSYLDGNYEEVWDKLNEILFFEDDKLLADARLVVQETMLRVRKNIVTVVGRLREINYQFMAETMAEEFGPPLTGDESSPYSPPEPQVGQFLEQIEQSVGPVPLVLRGWFEIVGSVNLIGTHPSLTPGDASILADPLVFMSPREIIRELSGEPIEPLRLPIFSSASSKAGYSSGGELCALHMGRGMDATIDTEPPQSFIKYLRHSLQWAGFPGLANTHLPMLEQLRAGLLPF